MNAFTGPVPRPRLAVLLVMGLAVCVLASGQDTASGGILPPPAGVVLIVDSTASPGTLGDGLCSLNEAIAAANINGVGDGSSGSCSAAGSQPGATDSIRFNIDPDPNPTISVTSSPPSITDKISIRGNTGGATRVVLQGPGSGAGLTVSGAGASGSTIRSLVVRNFGTGISLADTSSITIAGAFVGTDATGATAAGNNTGIDLYYSTATIGSATGVTAGGPCTGDCNVISGNAVGVNLRGPSVATLHANFIGTDATGMVAVGNTSYGLRVRERSHAAVGGALAGTGNVISGNGTGISFDIDSDIPESSYIQGNLLGTNVTGAAAIANAGDAISVRLSNNDHEVLIGGTGPGESNVISGNGGDGVELFSADAVALRGNFIGVLADGTTPLPNAGRGVVLSSSTHQNLIGGIGPGEGNFIASNGDDGVFIGVFDYYNQVRGNSIHDNGGKGIELADDQNGYAFTPAILGANPVSGTACANCIVDVYSDGANEGKVYEGSTVADGSGNWSFGGAVAGPNVTATATSASINFPQNLSTSEFSAPFALPAPATPTPSPTASPTATPAVTATPTPTATATPAATVTPTPTLTPTPVPTVTPTPTPTETPGPTQSATPTPALTATPSGKAIQGDTDCDEDVDSVDGLFVLRDVAGLSTSACIAQGDVDCDEDRDSVDALGILRHVATLPPLVQQEPCVNIGEQA